MYLTSVSCLTCSVVMFLSDMSGRVPLYKKFSIFIICLIQAFITDHERALEELLGENVENTRKFDNCLNTMATRISTIFASLKLDGDHPGFAT
ncbi:Protein transport Sec1a [Vitis vinifera]|uniref:Protein transport Sec1a n=1 Tax=Vitis vinifera TaxID=29760 RepID=A0A438E0H1_VITVI|nr:Protein transport Sec1a [Vitis vinifera]